MRSNSIRVLLAAGMLLLYAGAGHAQDIRYSWLDMSYIAQDVSRSGTLPTPGVPDQIVTVNAEDGSGVRFRGSFGTWYNMYIMFEYASSDIDLNGDVSNPQSPPVAFTDEFDYTTIRGGLGLKWTLFEKTDLFGEITYDSLDFDFGSFAGENFDMDRQEVGGTIGVRTLFGDHFMIQAHARYSGVGDADLTTGFFDDDTLFGLGFSWEIIRGFALVGDIEAGEFSNYAIGFRLDLDED